MFNLSDNFFILANNPFTYFADSNLAGKIIVSLLALFSVLAWSTMMNKYGELELLRRKNNETEKALSKAVSVIAAAVNFSKNRRDAYSNLLREAVSAWSRYEKLDGKNADLSIRMGLVENAIQRAISREIIKYEKKMILLGSIISGAPFLGLLGTTWGVMDSFGSMTKQSSATLQMLAPGVSGALLTTVAGLVVAIPSVFGYNFLLAKVKTMVIDLENFASSLADKIELESKILQANRENKSKQEEEEFKLKPISQNEEDDEDSSTKDDEDLIGRY